MKVFKKATLIVVCVLVLFVFAFAKVAQADGIDSWVKNELNAMIGQTFSVYGEVRFYSTAAEWGSRRTDTRVVPGNDTVTVSGWAIVASDGSLVDYFCPRAYPGDLGWTLADSLYDVGVYEVRGHAVLYHITLTSLPLDNTDPEEVSRERYGIEIYDTDLPLEELVEKYEKEWASSVQYVQRTGEAVRVVSGIGWIDYRTGKEAADIAIRDFRIGVQKLLDYSHLRDFNNKDNNKDNKNLAEQSSMALELPDDVTLVTFDGWSGWLIPANQVLDAILYPGYDGCTPYPSWEIQANGKAIDTINPFKEDGGDQREKGNNCEQRWHGADPVVRIRDELAATRFRCMRGHRPTPLRPGDHIFFGGAGADYLFESH